MVEMAFLGSLVLMVFMAGMDWMEYQVWMVFQEHLALPEFLALMVRMGIRGTRESEDLWDLGESEDCQDLVGEQGKMEGMVTLEHLESVRGRLLEPVLKKSA